MVEWHQVPIVQGEVKPPGDLVVRKVTYHCGKNSIERKSNPQQDRFLMRTTEWRMQRKHSSGNTYTM